MTQDDADEGRRCLSHLRELVPESPEERELIELTRTMIAERLLRHSREKA